MMLGSKWFYLLYLFKQRLIFKDKAQLYLWRGGFSLTSPTWRVDLQRNLKRIPMGAVEKGTHRGM